MNGKMILDTSKLLLDVLQALQTKVPKKHIAAATQLALACGLASIAIEAASSKGIKTVGGSGGVFYNQAITVAVRREVERAGLKFIAHEILPPGGRRNLGWAGGFRCREETSLTLPTNKFGGFLLSCIGQQGLCHQPVDDSSIADEPYIDIGLRMPCAEVHPRFHGACWLSPAKPRRLPASHPRSLPGAHQRGIYRQEFLSFSAIHPRD